MARRRRASPVPPAEAPHRELTVVVIAAGLVLAVLAVYAGRTRDGKTAARGAAKVRASLDRARQKETTRRAAQSAARQGFRTA